MQQDKTNDDDEITKNVRKMKFIRMYGFVFFPVIALIGLESTIFGITVSATDFIVIGSLLFLLGVGLGIINHFFIKVPKNPPH